GPGRLLLLVPTGDLRAQVAAADLERAPALHAVQHAVVPGFEADQAGEVLPGEAEDVRGQVVPGYLALLVLPDADAGQVQRPHLLRQRDVDAARQPLEADLRAVVELVRPQLRQQRRARHTEQRRQRVRRRVGALHQAGVGVHVPRVHAV